MKLAIMQPYLFPYLGYFQLVAAVDHFVFYDDVNFIKRGWINRNNILLHGESHAFTVPLEKASQNKRIVDTMLKDLAGWKPKFIATLQHAYKQAPNFEQVLSLIEGVFDRGDTDIAALAAGSIQAVSDYLGLSPQWHTSSETLNEVRGKGPERILNICQQMGATTYFNPVGGMEIYDRQPFKEAGISLHFLKMASLEYPQQGDPFVPYLSIIDVMMHNSPTQIRPMLRSYELL